MRRIFIIVLLLLVSCQLSVVSCFAAESNDFAVSVSPSILEIEAKQPSSPEAEINIQNRSEIDIVLDISLVPFTQDAQGTGQIKYLSAREAKKSLSIIQSQVKILNEGNSVSKLKLIPYESKTLLLKIDANSSLTPGDYYFTVLFTTEHEKIGLKSQIQAGGGVGTHVILSVDNNTQFTGRIKEFESPLFINKGPVSFKLLVENTGSHYSIPRGHINISNILGGQSEDISILPQYILGGARRYLIDNAKLGANNLTVIWPEKFLFGIYKATAIIKLKEGNPGIETSRYFISLPLLVIIVFTCLSFVFVGILVRTIKKLK